MTNALASAYLIFSHILPPIMGFFAVLLIASGIMDKKKEYTFLGVGLFFVAGILPFVILPFILGF
ncbi:MULTISPECIES: hypothetical protein [Methanobacterium]|uniref:Uncharacterized protein n=1 Tax=Methanobacterium bryantii TaxID=2161 RepID=A0A2A2H1X2_METBR|nr:MULTISPECIES: hypothetical protein [Methanobacterium]OEC87437.1 hypothetical protein A9507_07490 [Methanobacterium sp. A39]PAV03408.1 hypothetical protein ASJ80_00170 [Methanobacterium bryantii]